MLRADAEENRERLIEAAKALFAEGGLDVPMREVARRAGVGPATLYRRFPTKQDLVDAAFADELCACQTVVDTGAADPDPWHGLSVILRQLSELNARNHAFVDTFLSTYAPEDDLARHRGGLLRRLDDLCRRAQEAGSLRSDFVLDDLILLVQAGRGLSAATPEHRVARARRFTELVLDALRAPDRSAR